MIRQMKLVVPVVVILMTTSLVAQESLSLARDLYAAAEYEAALSMLNRLQSTAHAQADNRGIEQYRAFCLLALGRTSDAERAIEAVVKAEPSYTPSDTDVSPRLRTAFSDVRKRMLPGIIQDQYSQAKAAFDQKAYDVAASSFKDMLDTLADPAVGAAAAQPPLSDLRMLAKGFYELSAAAVPPPPRLVPMAAPPIVALTPGNLPTPPGMRIYGPQDADVQPPTALHQNLPEYDKRLGPPTGQAVLEVVIDESGNVQLAKLRGSVHPKYDSLALDAAHTWRYKPATRFGMPVKYTKIVVIAVKL